MPKVRYVMDYADDSVAAGFVFKAGTTAEHAEPDAAERIAKGVCVPVDENARARKLLPGEPLPLECVSQKQPKLEERK